MVLQRRALASITSTKPGVGGVGKHSYTYDPLGNIATWKREAPLANPTGATHQFTSAAYYDMANQVISVGNTPLPVSFTFETPSRARLPHRVAAHTAAVKSACSSREIT